MIVPEELVFCSNQSGIHFGLISTKKKSMAYDSLKRFQNPIENTLYMQENAVKPLQLKRRYKN